MNDIIVRDTGAFQPSNGGRIFRPTGGIMIKGLTPALPERGKIKIGIKGETKRSQRGVEFQPPVKLDHFVVTTLERDRSGNFKMDSDVHNLLGSPKPTKIPISLLYDDPTLNFPTRYGCYHGRTLWCSGDGEAAMRLVDEKSDKPDAPRHQVECPCPRKEPYYKGQDRCKMNGVLSCLIDGAGGLGGVWKLRTTSYNTIVGILSSMAFLKSITGGPLAGIPFDLVIRPKQVADPEGRAQVVYVVGLEYAGNMTELRERGRLIALDRATTHLYIETIEDQARAALNAHTPTVPLPGDTTDEIVEEFYPEQAQGDSAPVSHETPTERPKPEDFEPAKPGDGVPITDAPEPAPESDPPNPVYAFELVMPDDERLPYENMADFREAYGKHLEESFKRFGVAGGEGFFETNRPAFLKWAEKDRAGAVEMERLYMAMRNTMLLQPQNDAPNPPPPNGQREMW